ncbi:hypothetical protein LSAT2_027234 [Lamellibrachia satsuma]|nr:hypothetical protein LSAT2_027234 [Lamellibrachia satsuma]
MDFCRFLSLLSAILVVSAPPVAGNAQEYGVCVRMCDSNFLHCVVVSGCGRPFPLGVPDKCIKMRELCIERCQSVKLI